MLKSLALLAHLSTLMMNRDQQDRINRGDRLKAFRKSLKLNLDDFSALFDVGKSTLGHWENARGNGLSAKGAKAIAKKSVELAEANKTEHSTSYLWLYHGTFEEPSEISSNLNTFSNHFLKNNDNASIIEIHDNKYLPFLSPGDFIATISVPLSIKQPINHLCFNWENQNDFELVFVEEVFANNEIIAQRVNHASSVKEKMASSKLDLILWTHKPYSPST